MKKHTNQTDNEELKQFHCSILMEEVREKIDMLKEYGMSEKEIITYLLSEQSLPKLHISSNYRLLLGEERRDTYGAISEGCLLVVSETSRGNSV